MSAPPSFISELTDLAPSLVIFDKDGTLLDFEAMWGSWVIELAQRLEFATDLAIASRLYEMMGFSPDSGRILASGNLALTPSAELRMLTAELLREFELTPDQVDLSLDAAWHSPDPVGLAHPLTDLTILFCSLRAGGIKIAIATSDDRLPTLATLSGLGLAALVDAVVCADDGLPIKPAPDMILTICRTLYVPPAKTVMVGDNVDDLQMGRAAGVGLVVGVLSGVCSASELSPYADILLGSIADLVKND